MRTQRYQTVPISAVKAPGAHRSRQLQRSIRAKTSDASCSFVYTPPGSSSIRCNDSRPSVPAGQSARGISQVWTRTKFISVITRLIRNHLQWQLPDNDIADTARRRSKPPSLISRMQVDILVWTSGSERVGRILWRSARLMLLAQGTKAPFHRNQSIRRSLPAQAA